ncbi:yfkN, partial [Symbiodinium sp. KB8]
RANAPFGGAGRFCTKVKALRPAPSAAFTPALVLFSGDALSPSAMSTVTKGEQMVPILNVIGVDVAMAGNHDLDFGEDVLSEAVQASSFPWLLTNCLRKADAKPLGGCIPTLVKEWHGWRIGIMGLIEQDWLATLATVDPEDVVFTDFIKAGTAAAAQLRLQGVDIVIALTHMRLPNDRRLADGVPGIDLILGGHDHAVAAEMLGGVPLVKSGTDFENLTEISVMLRERPTAEGDPAPPDVAEKATRGADGQVELEGEFHARRVRVTTSLKHLSASDTPDPEVEEIVERYGHDVIAKLDAVLGTTRTTLDGRFSRIRTKETAVGNLVADLMRAAVRADITILNSGTLRSDSVVKPGDVTMRDLQKLLPMASPVCKLRLTGAQVLAALENAVSAYPKLEGRFAQVSGVKFEFDATKPAGSRIVPGSVQVVREGGLSASAVNKAGEMLSPGLASPAVALEELDLEAEYTVAVQQYLTLGRDGFDMLKPAGDNLLVDHETGPLLPILLANHFRALQVLNAMADKQAGEAERHGAAKLLARLGGRGAPATAGVEYAIAPRVEGRITVAKGAMVYEDEEVWEKQARLRLLRQMKAEGAAAADVAGAAGAAATKASSTSAGTRLSSGVRLAAVGTAFSDECDEDDHAALDAALAAEAAAADAADAAQDKASDIAAAAVADVERKAVDDVQEDELMDMFAQADAAAGASLAKGKSAKAGAEEEAAAVRIQAAARGKAAREQVQGMKASAADAAAQRKRDAEAAASEGKEAARSAVSERKEAAEASASEHKESAEAAIAERKAKAAAAADSAKSAKADAEEEAAAVRIQAAARGKAARGRVQGMRAGAGAAATAGKAGAQEEAAAIRIQAAARGRAARSTVASMKGAWTSSQ